MMHFNASVIQQMKYRGTIGSAVCTQSRYATGIFTTQTNTESNSWHG